VAQGTVGAGTGATVGKMGGPSLRMKGGLGSASAVLPSGHRIGALAAVNALGDVYDEASGRIAAGARSPSGKGWLADELAAEWAHDEAVRVAPLFPGTNTTIALVASDAPLSKVELAKLAQMAHDGLARAIRPAHTPYDGDTVFALSTAPHPPASGEGQGTPEMEVLLAGALAARTLSRAILKAVRAATGLPGVPAARDLPAM
jgi:L-aminopeptidase/D-esterase-like protein